MMGMMGYGNFGGPMMGSGGGFVGSLLLVTWVVWLVVGILLAIFLWKKISEK